MGIMNSQTAPLLNSKQALKMGCVAINHFNEHPIIKSLQIMTVSRIDFALSIMLTAIVFIKDNQ